MSQNQDSRSVYRAAQAAIEEAKAALASSDEFYRKQALDPEKVKSVCAAHISKEQKEQAQALFDADLREIELQVAEKAAYTKSAQPATGGPKKTPRPMV